MADTSRHVLDASALHHAVAAVALHRRIGLRTVASETGISPSTLTRLKNGQKPDADGLMSLLAWLGYSVPFTRTRDG